MNRDWVLIPAGGFIKCQLLRIKRVSGDGNAVSVDAGYKNEETHFLRHNRPVPLNQIRGELEDAMPKEATAP